MAFSHKWTITQDSIDTEVLVGDLPALVKVCSCCVFVRWCGHHCASCVRCKAVTHKLGHWMLLRWFWPRLLVEHSICSL